MAGATSSKVPLGIQFLPSLKTDYRDTRYRIYTLVFTFLCYTSYHCSRKPISVVKNELHFANCSGGANDTSCDWKPFDHANAKELLGSLDYAYLFAYALGMFASGHIAERMNLRHFLSIGMICSGIMTIAFGMGYFWKIHIFTYYLGVQIVCGFVQASGWPSVVTTVGNWFGKGKRGLIMGIWNCHTSVGNIFGSLIAGIFVSSAWGWSFVLPGLIILVFGVLVFFFHVPKPEDVGCSLPDHEGQRTPMSVQYDEQEVTDEINEEDSPLVANASSINNEIRHLPAGDEQPISFRRALFVPGVIEFSVCLFFAKLVSYTFLFWLPNYIKYSSGFTNTQAADLSTVFDIGGATGGILAGVVSDLTGGRASTCAIMLILAAPTMYTYNVYGTVNIETNIVLLFICGLFVNGTYALITTAVSADLGTHKSLRGNARALATVTAIIDGTGSMGAALGPFLCGLLAWDNVFYMLIASDIMALLFLSRLVTKEVQSFLRNRRLSTSGS